VQPLLSPTRIRPRNAARIGACSEILQRHTREALEFVDLTDEVAACARRSGIDHGVVSVQSRHTTAAIVVNENEPLLLADLRERLERFAPAGAGYRHDDFALRTQNLAPDERANGHAHVRALVLPCSVSLNLVDGELQLGRWQRIFLAELDCGRPREVSVLVLGVRHGGEDA
jgi:secondary thiamine-phosphate synthase enzyme